MNRKLTIQDIAKICHEANRAYCAALADNSQQPWEATPDWQRASAIKGVEFALAYPDAGPEASHESWLAEKRRDGWTYGPVKDAAKKQQPCYVAFAGLPEQQQAKDYLFTAIVKSLRHLVVD
jgi:hypothetical protein